MLKEIFNTNVLKRISNIALSFILVLSCIVTLFGFNTVPVKAEDSGTYNYDEATGFRLLPSTDVVTMYMKDNYTIELLGNPSYQFNTKWTSGDSNVMTVSSGKLTPNSIGKTVIYADITYTIPDDSETHYVRLSQKVEVKPSVVTITSKPEYVTQDDYQMTYSCTAQNQKISWTSSRPDVATISNTGVVKGVSSGKTVITATTDDGTTDSYELEVRVAPERITLTTQTPKLTVIGQKAEITATFQPTGVYDSRLIWESSNPLAATVSQDGVVTAQNITGTNTVTITAKSVSNPSIIGTITIEVSIAETELIAVEKKFAINMGKSKQCAVIVNPFGFNSSQVQGSGVTWKSSDSSICKVDQTTGVVTGIKPGRAIITAQYGNLNLVANITVDVKPLSPRISTVRETEKTIKVTLTKQSDVTGYQIEYSTSSKFKNSKRITIKDDNDFNTTKISKQLKGLATKDYFFRTRSYYVKDGVTVYGDWSTTNYVNNYIILKPSASKYKVTEGKKITLSAKLVSSDKKLNRIKSGRKSSGIKFESSNSKIAKVDKYTGKVTGVKAGKCKIKVTYKGITKTVTVTVKEDKKDKDSKK